MRVIPVSCGEVLVCVILEEAQLDKAAQLWCVRLLLPKMTLLVPADSVEILWNWADKGAFLVFLGI